MKTETLLRGVIVILFISLIVISFQYLKQNREFTECKIINDSLQTELFISNNVNGRYEIALESFKEKDSIAAHKFEDILYSETE